MKKRRCLLAAVLCLSVLFSTAGVCAAELDTKINEAEEARTIGSGTVGLERVRALRGKAVLSASSFSTDLEYIKATITVERKYTSGWSQYATPYDVYGDARLGELLVTEYIDVAESGTYRIKVVFEDKIGSVITRTTGLYSQAVSL